MSSSTAVGQAGVELATDGIGRIGQEVVAGDEARVRGHDAVGGEVGVDHPDDLGRGLDQAPDGEVWDREGRRADVHRLAGAVRVLAEDVVTAQARLGDRVALRRREVTGLLPEQALVGVAEERDDGVVAEDRHVAQRLGRIGVGRRRAIRVDDALDLLRDEVLRERTAAVVLGIGLGLERMELAVVLVGEVDEDAVDLRSRAEVLDPVGEGLRPSRCRGRAADESVTMTVV